MRAPQQASFIDPATYDIALRIISALIGVVVLVGLTAAVDSPRPQIATTSVASVAGPLPTRLPNDFAVAPLTKSAPAQRVAATPKPAKAVAKKTTRKAPVKRWLPSGTGMWLHEWESSNGGNAHNIVTRAKRAGISTLYVRGWSKKNGNEAPGVLRQLLPATKGTNIKVVVWEFAYLQNPVAEARRLAAAAKVRVPGAPRVVAVAPDIETAAEGTALNARRVMVYMATLRKSLPADVSILATVPWPSEVRVGHYPYAATAHYANAILPMTYWYNRSPVAVTASSIAYLKRFKRPIMPVGQGYDGRLDAPWLPRVNIGKQVAAFLVTAKRQHVRAVSIWSWQTAPQSVWGRLSGARHDFKAPVVRATAPKVAVPAPVSP
jgi:hypothetical protein